MRRPAAPPTRPFYECANCPHPRHRPEPGAIRFLTPSETAYLLRNNSHHRPQETVPAAQARRDRDLRT